jgi:hypothetical protein
MPHLSCSFMILNLFFIITGISQKMTGNQHSCLYIQQNRPKMQGKKVDYLPFLLPPLFRNTWGFMGLHPLQDYKERRCQDQPKNMEELVHFLQESTGACILFEFLLILHTPCKCSQNLLEVLHHSSKHLANTRQI